VLINGVREVTHFAPLSEQEIKHMFSEKVLSTPKNEI
jgi:hypothetical protein